MVHLTGDQRRATDADRTPPVVERIQHIRLAELDPHRTASRSLRLVPLAAAIDAAERNLERDPAFSPRAHLFESRPDDPDQMALVLAAEVGLDLAAVRGRVVRRLNYDARFFCHIKRRPSSVRSGSIRSIPRLSSAITPARPPVPMTMARSPAGSSARIRRMSPSTIST